MTKFNIPEINPFIIGAGGVASYLLPVLIRTFPIPQMWIRDADKLEERNLDRQLFKANQIGEYKAEALLNMIKIKPRTQKAWIAQNQWFADGELPPHGSGLIICVADNHTARRAALEAAEACGIPCVIGGNEYYDSQAFWVYPEDLHGRYDPRNRYKTIAEDTSQNPVTCTGEALISNPQLAMANMRCASQIMELLWLHLVIAPYLDSQGVDMCDQKFPHEIYTALNNTEYHRYDQ
jgi:molybdopterin/thiamine biosynthesis adenylyltransferase